MSATPQPVSPAPEPVAPKAAATRGPSLWSGAKLLIWLIVLGAVGFGIWRMTQSKPPQTEAVATARTAAVRRSSLEQRLRVNGLTSARNYENVIAPRMRGPGGNRELNILKLAPSGSLVKKGQVVAELDPQNTRDALDDEVAKLKEAENDIAKRKAEQELAMETLSQQLRVAKSDWDKAVLDSKISEVRTDIDRELLRLAVEETEARYKELSTDVAQTEASNRADLRYLQIARQIQQIRVDRYQEDLERLTVHASMDGLVVMQTYFQPGGDQRQIQEGDRVSPGQPFMKIIDQSTMQVEGVINQAESSSFRVGQEARIGLDAFPDAAYTAKVYAIGALATGGRITNYFVRSVPIRVQLTSVDKRVIPDLSASADVLMGKAENVLVAPLSAVEKSGGQYFVEVKTPTGFEKRLVQIGLGDGTQVVVLDGLREGEEIRIS